MTQQQKAESMRKYIARIRNAEKKDYAQRYAIWLMRSPKDQETIEQWNRSQNEERTRKLQAAAEQGYCVRCLVKSGFRKEVKHRKPCPHGAN